MAETTIVHARIDKELKNNAESIFAQLGLTSTDAIKMFYKQVELHGGLPFDLKVPDRVLAEQKLLEEIELGRQSALQGGYKTISDSKSLMGLPFDLTDDEKIDVVAARILQKYRAAFEELAK